MIVSESDSDLVRRAQAEDIDAFCLLAERYARRIHLLASHYCRNSQDAEDLSQEVWLKAYQAQSSSLEFLPAPWSNDCGATRAD
jgi:RNA polymerase sigma-70 factor (ECF subfamily)